MRQWDSESIDLIYADPPFNTGKDWGAYDDRWAGLDEYLAFMNERLLEMYRLLKPTGSLYLHCDWRANAYLRIALDRIFGRRNFRNAIAWCYSGGSSPSKDFRRKHDTILRYAKTERATFHVQYQPYSGDVPLLRASAKGMSARRGMALRPEGMPLNDWWSDIKPIINWDSERTGYPTQKPLKLLERIIRASSNPGDLVFDPFLGSGTTAIAAESLKREWTGCDLWESGAEAILERLDEAGIPYRYSRAAS